VQLLPKEDQTIFDIFFGSDMVLWIGFDLFFGFEDDVLGE